MNKDRVSDIRAALDRVEKECEAAEAEVARLREALGESSQIPVLRSSITRPTRVTVQFSNESDVIYKLVKE